MSNKKVVNYSPETTAKMIEVYQAAGDSDEERKTAMLEIQEFTGKSLASIRSKLGFENVYIAQAKPTPKGKTGLAKSEIVSLIQDAEPVKPSGFFDSIEAANKSVLEYVLNLQAVVRAYQEDEADEIVALLTENDS